MDTLPETLHDSYIILQEASSLFVSLLCLELFLAAGSRNTLVLSWLPMSRCSPLTVTVVPPDAGPNEGCTENILASSKRKRVLAIPFEPFLLSTVSTTSATPCD